MSQVGELVTGRNYCMATEHGQLADTVSIYGSNHGDFGRIASSHQHALRRTVRGPDTGRNCDHVSLCFKYAGNATFDLCLLLSIRIYLLLTFVCVVIDVR
jgi:hypothetical protein